MVSSDDMVEDKEKLCNAATKGNWADVLKMFKEKRELRAAEITETKYTVLHMAVCSGKEDVVESMVDLVCGKSSINGKDETLALLSSSVDENGDEQKLVLGAENEQGNTPLHLAALMGNVEMCRKIGRIEPSLIAARNIAGETPFFLAALYGRKEAFLWLHYLNMGSPGVSSTDIAHGIRNNGDTILHCAIAEGHIDVAIEIVHLYKDHMKEMMKPNKEGLSPLHFLAAKPSAFKSSGLHELSSDPARAIYRYCFLRVKKKSEATRLGELKNENEKYIFPEFVYRFLYRLPPFLQLLLGLPLYEAAERWLHKILKMKEAHTWSVQIMEKLLQQASNEDMSQKISRTASEHLSISLQTQDKDDGTITIETPLMIAAKNGVVEMVERIIELFPSRIKDVNAEEKNILLLAVEYRQTAVYIFLWRQKWLSESLFRQVDKDGNNALHLAARLVGRNWLINPGEINWFDFVKDSAPRGLSGRYNKKMETPEDIFRESHDELIKGEAERAAKTSEACSVVSILVASVAFATRSSVPGGYDEQGYAILRNKSGAFGIFLGFEMLALIFSLISTICFLSILASPSQSVHSLRTVSFKLYSGICLMFYSIVLLWGSFCAGHFFSLGDFYKKLSYTLPTYIFLSSVITLLILSQLSFIVPIFFTALSVPGTRRQATPPIQYRRTNDKENTPVLSRQN